MAARKKKEQPKPPRGIRKRVLADGTIKYDPLVSVSKNGKAKQVSLGVCDTFDDAVAMRHAYFKELAKRGEPLRADPGILTVAQLGAMCLKDAPEWDVDRWRARILEMAEFADWPATQVTEEHVQIWVDKMATTPIASGRGKGKPPTRPTVFSALSLLRRVYTWANKPARKYVTHNPALNVTIGNSTDVKLKSARNVLDYLREDEAKLLIEAKPDVLPLEHKAKFVTIMVAGPRPVDVWRLDWERFDWKGESIRFTSSKTSKEQESDYVVHPLPQLWAVLREWWMACGRPTSGLVFPAGVNEDGSQRVFARGYDAGWQDKRERRNSVWYVDPTASRSLSATPGMGAGRPGELTRREALELRRKKGERREQRSELKVRPGYRTKLGIKRNVPLYALRHTCACNLLLGSPLFTGGRMWSREEVQSQLGHKDSKATEHYMRALGILGRRAAQESKTALKELKKRGSDS